jgi:hypothetical protein
MEHTITGFAPEPITTQPVSDWQQASELFMPLRLEGVSLQMTYDGNYEVRLTQSHNLVGERLPEYRQTDGEGKSFVEAMTQAIEYWSENYGNQE